MNPELTTIHLVAVDNESIISQTTLPTRLILEFTYEGRTIRSDYGYELYWRWNPPLGEIHFDVQIRRLTPDITIAFDGTLSEFAQRTASDISDWFRYNNQYMISVRPFQLVNSIKVPGIWSQPATVQTSPVATLLPVRDAASVDQIGFRTAGPTAVAAASNSDWYLKIYLSRFTAVQSEIEIRDLSRDVVVALLTITDNHGQDLSALLEDGPLPPGRYSVRIRTKVAFVYSGDPFHGNSLTSETWTNWSETQVFNIYVAPVVIMSGGGATLDTTPGLRWQPVPDAASYEVWIGKRGEAQPVYSRTGITGRSHSVATPLANGEYVVFIRARLTGGGVSQWGTGLPLIIGAPVNLVVAPGTNEISWTRVPDASRYEIWVNYLGGAAPAGSRVIHETRWRQTRFALPESAPAGRYRVWVRAILYEGRATHRSTWSSVVNVVVVAGRPIQDDGLAWSALSWLVLDSSVPDAGLLPDKVVRTSDNADRATGHPETDCMPVVQSYPSVARSQAISELSLPSSSPAVTVAASEAAVIDLLMSDSGFTASLPNPRKEPIDLRRLTLMASQELSGHGWSEFQI